LIEYESCVVQAVSVDEVIPRSLELPPRVQCVIHELTSRDEHFKRPAWILIEALQVVLFKCRIGDLKGLIKLPDLSRDDILSRYPVELSYYISYIYITTSTLLSVGEIGGNQLHPNRDDSTELIRSVPYALNYSEVPEWDLLPRCESIERGSSLNPEVPPLYEYALPDGDWSTSSLHLLVEEWNFDLFGTIHSDLHLKRIKYAHNPWSLYIQLFSDEWLQYLMLDDVLITTAREVQGGYEVQNGWGSVSSPPQPTES
jgi:hypothetical protein